VTHPCWPLLDLRLTVGDLELTPLVEADLAEVVRLMPADLELNPTATRFAVDESTHRRVVVHQEYWRSYGTWTTEAWRFQLAVRRDGELLGSVTPSHDAPAWVQVLPDEQTVLIANQRGQFYEWDIRPGHLLDFGCTFAGRDLTTREWQDVFGERKQVRVCNGSTARARTGRTRGG